MRKLKQSAALLLLVSFLLSMFSFSVFAANQITVNICPRLLKDQQALNAAKGHVGDPGGQIIKNASFDLYKLGDLDMAEPNKMYNCETNPVGQNEFPFDKNKPSQEVEINGQKYKFYSEPDVVKNATTNNHGVAAVKFNANESGWYIAIMHDAGEKTCLPTFIYVDTESSNTAQDVFPKAVDMANDNDLPSFNKYILGPNETRYLSKSGKKFVNGGEEQDRTIDYQIDVGIPVIKGLYKGNESARYLGELKEKYTVFSVTDDALANNELVEKLADKCYNNVAKQVEVTMVDREDHVLYTLNPEEVNDNGDYTLSINGKTLNVDFLRGGRGFSNNVGKVLWEKRNGDNVRFRIRFSVKIKDLVKYFLEKKQQLLQNSPERKFLEQVAQAPGKLDINNLGFSNVEEAFKKLLRVENTAKFDVQKGQNKKTLLSNKVICQFGILCLRKLDKQGNKLQGAIFDLLSDKPNSMDTNNLDYKKKWLGDGYVDPNSGDRYFAFLAGLSVKIEKGKEKESSINQLNNLAENGAKADEKFYLNETKAPDGYEQLKKLVEVNLSGGFNYKEVVNIPKIAMPFTGGVGTILFTVVGILLIGSGAYLLINAKRKKSAE